MSALRSVSDGTWKGLAVLVFIVGIAGAIGMVRAGRDRRRLGQSQPVLEGLGKLVFWAIVLTTAGVSIAYAKARGWIA